MNPNCFGYYVPHVSVIVSTIPFGAIGMNFPLSESSPLMRTEPRVMVRLPVHLENNLNIFMIYKARGASHINSIEIKCSFGLESHIFL